MLAFWPRDRDTNRQRPVCLLYPACIASRRIQRQELYIFCALWFLFLVLTHLYPMPLLAGSWVEIVLP